MQNTIKMRTVRIGTIFDGYDIHRPRKNLGGMVEVQSGAEFPFELSQNEILKSCLNQCFGWALCSVCACDECVYVCMANTLAAVRPEIDAIQNEMK